MKRINLLLLAIIILASVLRLWQLGHVPPSPDWDEAALGYNAKSILLTGKDEYGQSFPIVLRSFDDYKPAFYAYLIIPFLFFFHLSLIAVRMPSVVAGIVAVIATYYLVREITRDSQLDNLLEIGNWKLETAHLVAFLLAISPWHIQFSRIGFEANVALTFVILCFLFFVRGLKRPWLLSLAAICAGLTLYIYQSAKVFTPLFVIALVIIFLKNLIRIKRKWLVLAVLAGVVTVLPMALYILFTPDALIRAKGLSIFSHDTVGFLNLTSKRLLVDHQNHDFLGLIFDNRRIVFLKGVIFGYLAHFNPVWLFIVGDSLRHHAPFMGMLYIFEIPFLVWGILAFIFSKIDLKMKLAVFAQFLITPIPASITFDIPSAVRTINFLPTFQIFTAFGIIAFVLLLNRAKKGVVKFAAVLVGVIVVGISIYNVIYYLDQYFVQQNYYASSFWQYGYEDAVKEVKATGDQYDKIVVESRAPMDQSYMFFLYFLDYSPKLYQQIGHSDAGGFDAGHSYGKYEFRPINWDTETRSGKILYIAPPKDFPQSIVPVKTIKFLDGSVHMLLVKGDAKS